MKNYTQTIVSRSKALKATEIFTVWRKVLLPVLALPQSFCLCFVDELDSMEWRQSTSNTGTDDVSFLRLVAYRSKL